MKSGDANHDSAQGDALRITQLTHLVQHLLAREEQAKARFANQLHDELGSHLTAINLDVTSVAMRLKDPQPQLAERLERCLGLLRESVEITRRMMHALRPSMLDSLGLGPALRMLCEEFSERTRIACVVDGAESLPELEAGTAVALCRVAEEALNNVEQHARAREVRVTLRHDAARLTLEIRDDGVGITHEALTSATAFGLLTMHERLARAGGHSRVRIGDSGSGTIVEAVVPLGALAAAQ